MSKLDQLRGEATRAFNPDHARVEEKFTAQDGTGANTESIKPEFNRAAQGPQKAGSDKPGKDLDREPAKDLKRQAGHKVVKKSRSPSLER